MSRIKGASLINAIGVLRDFLDPARLQALAAQCPVESQQLLLRTLVALDWVPLAAWTPILQVVYEQIFRKDEQQFRRLLRAVCKRDFTGVYRVYVKLNSPHEILNKVQSIWPAYFDTGSLTTEPREVPSGQHQVIVKMTDLETSAPLVATMMHAYLEQLMAMGGAANCIVSRGKERLFGGKLSCDYQIEFSG